MFDSEGSSLVNGSLIDELLESSGSVEGGAYFKEVEGGAYFKEVGYSPGYFLSLSLLPGHNRGISTAIPLCYVILKNTANSHTLISEDFEAESDDNDTVALLEELKIIKKERAEEQARKEKE